MNSKHQTMRTAKNYLTIKGECNFEAKTALECEADGGNDCGRYWKSFFQCTTEEFCYSEAIKLRECHDDNKRKYSGQELRKVCAQQDARLEKCMRPRLDALAKYDFK